jgi:hypothetical protein
LLAPAPRPRSCGYFLDTGNDGSQPMNVTYPLRMKYVFGMQNSTGSLSPECQGVYGIDAWKCIMAPHAAKFIRTPWFALQVRMRARVRCARSVHARKGRARATGERGARDGRAWRARDVRAHERRAGARATRGRGARDDGRARMHATGRQPLGSPLPLARLLRAHAAARGDRVCGGHTLWRRCRARPTPRPTRPLLTLRPSRAHPSRAQSRVDTWQLGNIAMIPCTSNPLNCERALAGAATLASLSAQTH